MWGYRFYETLFVKYVCTKRGIESDRPMCNKLGFFYAVHVCYYTIYKISAQLDSAQGITSHSIFSLRRNLTALKKWNKSNL